MKILRYPKPVRQVCPACLSEFEIGKKDFKKNRATYKNGSLCCICPVCGKAIKDITPPFEELRSNIDYHFQEAAKGIKSMPKDEQRKRAMSAFESLYESFNKEFDAYKGETDEEEVE